MLQQRKSINVCVCVFECGGVYEHLQSRPASPLPTPFPQKSSFHLCAGAADRAVHGCSLDWFSGPLRTHIHSGSDSSDVLELFRVNKRFYNRLHVLRWMTCCPGTRICFFLPPAGEHTDLHSPSRGGAHAAWMNIYTRTSDFNLIRPYHGRRCFQAGLKMDYTFIRKPIKSHIYL